MECTDGQYNELTGGPLMANKLDEWLKATAAVHNVITRGERG